MATNFQEEGHVLNYQNTGSAITSNSVVVIGNLLGVALVDIAAATGDVDSPNNQSSGAVALKGVFASMPKTTGSAWVAGRKLLWDVSAGKFDVGTATPATGDLLGGAVVWEAAASGDTTGVVMLTPNGSTVVT